MLDVDVLSVRLTSSSVEETQCPGKPLPAGCAIRWSQRWMCRFAKLVVVYAMKRSRKQCQYFLNGGVPLQPSGASVVGVPTRGVARAGETTLAGVLPPEGTPIGKISVLSSRFFLGLGSGAAEWNVSMP